MKEVDTRSDVKGRLPQKSAEWTDSGFAWLIVAMSFFACLGVVVNEISLGALFPELLEHFQVPQSMLGLLGSVKVVTCDIISGESYS